MPDSLSDPVVGRDGDPATPPAVTVSLEPTPAGGKPPQTPAPATKPAKDGTEPTSEDARMAWLERQAAAQRRVIERLEQSVQTLTSRLTPSTPAGPTPKGKEALPPGTPQTTVDRYDQLVDGGHWQEAVGLIAEERTKALLDERDRTAAEQRLEAERQQTAQRHLTLLASSKARVAGRYAMLDTETGDNVSPEAQLYAEAFKQVEQETPDALTYPTAPELVMYRMEDLARQRGVALHPTLPTPLPGAPRGVPAGVTPPSRGTGGGRTTTLTSEERQFCDYYGLKYEDYAKHRVALTTNAEVSA